MNDNNSLLHYESIEITTKNSEQYGYAYVDDINNEINKILKGLAK